MTRVARIHYEIPDDLHRQAKSAAALEGKTLKDFVIDAIATSVNALQDRDRKQRSRDR